MLKNNKLDKTGFTLIELLMVILVIGILATIGITQFVNFSKDAKNAATKSSLQVLRRGIAAQRAMMAIRCEVTSGAWPDFDDVEANDITDTSCASFTAAVPVGDRPFVQGGIPSNPWNEAADTTAADDVIATCDNTGGWCYDETTGVIKANTNNNGEAVLENAF